jgi:hypothetical protein
MRKTNRFWFSTKIFVARSTPTGTLAAGIASLAITPGSMPTNFVRNWTGAGFGLGRSIGTRSLVTFRKEGCAMTKIDERTIANMDVVLEEACRGLPHGGDHEIRKHIAKKLVQSVKNGNATLEGLRSVAGRALAEFSSRKTA